MGDGGDGAAVLRGRAPGLGLLWSGDDVSGAIVAKGIGALEMLRLVLEPLSWAREASPEKQ